MVSLAFIMKKLFIKTIKCCMLIRCFLCFKYMGKKCLKHDAELKKS